MTEGNCGVTEEWKLAAGGGADVGVVALKNNIRGAETGQAAGGVSDF